MTDQRRVSLDELRIMLIKSPKRVLRMLERLRVFATCVPPETLAEAIFPHIRVDQLVEAHQYLGEVANCIHQQMLAQMQWKCAACGNDIWFTEDLTRRRREFRRVRRNARYCSQACRQKAYRKRKSVTAIPSNTEAKTSRVTVSAVQEAPSRNGQWADA
jgi:hypothetical protein